MVELQLIYLRVVVNVHVSVEHALNVFKVRLHIPIVNSLQSIVAIVYGCSYLIIVASYLSLA
jgi:hypothetical protein